MIYLRSFRYLSRLQEEVFVNNIRRTCYTSYYPFMIFGDKWQNEITFEPITIFYGDNGSGKTTALNLIAETYAMERSAPFNKTAFFAQYVEMLKNQQAPENMPHKPEQRRFIASDDVFQFMLDCRRINDGIDSRRDEILNEWIQKRKERFQMSSLEEYQELCDVVDARRRTQSEYARRRLSTNIRTQSNGESALTYFSEHIREKALYLLDEPENSLSPQKQMELTQFILDSSRFYACQFIIATHSPFLLALKGARVYNMDTIPVTTCRWTELENMRTYYDFFIAHTNEFNQT